MMMTSPATPSGSLEQLFAYGQTRERYLMKEGEPRRATQHIQQFVRHEHLDTLRQALLRDKALLQQKTTPEWQLGLSPISRQCLWELHSGILIRLLENISGQTQLLPDAQCRHLSLMDITSGPVSVDSWHDTVSDLPIALYVFIGLDTGEAILYPDKQHAITLNEPTLQVAYYHYSGEAT